MATHPIAGDAAILNVQLLQREKRLIGQAAQSKGYRSVGDYVRSLIQQGLEIEDPELSQKYRAARVNRYIQSVGLMLIGSLVIWQSVFSNTDLIRRIPSRGLARQHRREEVA